MNLSNSSVQLSVVSPVYLAEGIVGPFVDAVSTVLHRLVGDDYEIVLVEDGGNDESWLRIAEEASKNHRVKGIKLSRNFGQHRAITAGLSHSRGERVVVMDCDLQDKPEDISRLLEESNKGFDIVYSRRRKREFSTIKNLGARAFALLFNLLSEDRSVKTSIRVGAFSMLSRKVVNEFNRMPAFHRHYLLILRELGFSSSVIDVEHVRRYSGKSSYTLRKLIQHAIDGTTAHSTRLLKISITLGILFCVLSFFLIALLLILYLKFDFLEGWTSLAVLILFSTGIILSVLGVIGLYLGNIFLQVRGTPLFIVDETLNVTCE